MIKGIPQSIYADQHTIFQSPNQPKNRLQGLNPSWQMDWEGFIGELEEAAERTSVDIPEEAKVVYQEQVEDPV